MIPAAELKRIARARLADAEALRSASRYDGAMYVCGYAIELALKWRICNVLHWAGFPSTGGEFQKYQSFRTHDLEVLLHLSGREAKIKERMFAEWSVVAEWEPGARYKPIGTAGDSDVQLMIDAATKLLGAL